MATASKARRPAGLGTAPRLRPDGRYEIQLSARRPDGSRQRLSAYGRTPALAQTAAAKLRRTLEQGRRPADGREQVAPFLARWLVDVVALDRAPDTQVLYGGHVRRYLVPALGQKRLDAVRSGDLQALYARLQRQGLAPSTIRVTHAVAHAAFGWAADDLELIARNPAHHAHPPRARSAHRPTLTAAQARSLLAGAAGTELEALWWLLLTTGLRLGEARSLTWSAVELGRGVVAVRDSKTPSGRRLVALCAPTRQQLGAHWERERARWARLDLEPPGYVFPTGAGVPWAGSHLRTYRWYPLLARLGLPRVRPHDLRHTAATLLRDLGVPLTIIREILGHASITITADVYTASSPELQRTALDQLGALLAEPLAVNLAVNGAASGADANAGKEV